MATPAVQAASCAGAATAVITTTVVVVPTADARPEYSVYTEEINQSGKFGKDVWMLLIDHNKNKDWWEWSFRQLEVNKKSSSLETSFKSLTSGFDASSSDGTAESKALNKYCHHLFKTENTTTLSSINSKDKAIWKYCSPLGQVPVLIETEESKSYSTNAQNLGVTKKDTLISYSSFQNGVFWELKNEWFKKQEITDLFFQPFKGDSEKGLKEACKKAYSTTKVNNGGSAATASNPKETDVIKYCGLKIT